MWRFIVRFFAVVGFLLVLLIVGAGIAVYDYTRREEPMPRSIVLDLDLRDGLVEIAPDDPLVRYVSGPIPNLRDAIEAIDHARLDPRVKGLVARFGDDTLGFAQAQELRDAVARFRESGRFAYAFSTSFGEFGPGNAAYYLASGFEQVWLQPVGTVGLTGFSVEIPFAREALDKLGLEPQIGRRGKYKSAPESVTETDFTPANLEMITELVGDLTDQLAIGVAAGRGLDPDAVRRLIDRGPFLADEALEARLIDRIGYLDELDDEAFSRAGEDSGFVDVADYAESRRGTLEPTRPQIAVIYGIGTIAQGQNEDSSPLGEAIMGSDSITAAFDEAVESDEVRAIVLRIDSGGGSAVASEVIRRAVVRARAMGKPVVVSMGDTAASGGYWIAMDADRIVAQPGTLTGSIGVFAGKIVTAGLWEKLGVSWGRVSVGEHADMWSSQTPYSASETRRLEAMLDNIYEAFVTNVARARDLPVEQVREVAQGRVWTGAQAERIGLVDALGGMDTALSYARELAGVGADEAVEFVTFPKPRTPFEELMSLLKVRQSPDLSTLARELRLRELGALAAPAGERALALPPLVVR